MKLNKLPLTCCVFLSVCFTPAIAQNYIGLGGSNYAGVNGIYYNPASIVDSRYIVDINLFTVGLFASNNYLSYNLVKDEVKENLSFQRKNAYFTLDIRGLSAMYSLNLKRSSLWRMKRFGFAVDNRFRTALSVSRVAKSTAELAYNGQKDTTLQNIDFFDAGFDIDVMAWREMGFTVGAQLVDNDDVVMNAAVHIKRLYGIGGGYVHNYGGKYRVTHEDTIWVTDVNAEYGHSTANFFGNDKPEEGAISEYDEAGSGFGFDLGFMYEYRPDIFRYSYQRRLSDNNNKYKFRLGAALLDLGSIKFTKGSRQFRYQGDNFISRAEIDALHDPYDFDTLAKSKFEMLTSAEYFKMRLPSSFNVQFDYNMHPRWYLNLNFIGGFRHRKTYGIRQADFLTVTPRFEMPYFELAMPVAIKDFSQAQIGAMVKLGVLTIGSDNIAGIIFSEGNGLDFYVSARIPIFSK